MRILAGTLVSIGRNVHNLFNNTKARTNQQQQLKTTMAMMMMKRKNKQSSRVNTNKRNNNDMPSTKTVNVIKDKQKMKINCKNLMNTFEKVCGEGKRQIVGRRASEQVSELVRDVVGRQMKACV